MASLNFTPMLRPVFARQRRRALCAHLDPERTQRRVLASLLKQGAKTAYFKQLGIASVNLSAELFAQAVPLAEYPDLRPWVMRMVAGEPDMLWPGTVRRFAQSSGTTDGKSKYIPITDISLRANHYRGGVYSVAHYLHHNPSSRLFSGKTFILGGSFANEIDALPRGVKVGDLSAHLIECINPLVEKMRLPDRRTALLADWREKLPALVQASLHADVTSISGVPSWFLTVIREVMAAAGASSIHEVWPNLEVFFHGGISFAPYREQYRRICSGNMHFLETYNASEGFFAVQDTPDNPGMMLMLDDGIFYEFIPLSAPDAAPLPAWLTSPGESYELVISSCNGLWRYRPGDTVKVVSLDPLRIVVDGRTKQYINAFGEELMVHNAEQAMERACSECGCHVANYTAAPVYAAEGRRGRHQWLVEFHGATPDMDAFTQALDAALCAVNSDYQAKRAGSLFLDPPEVLLASPGLFERWLAATGRLGGQRKVPRLCPDRRYIDPLIKLNSTPLQ